jgi:class 3 adenylate cyclase
MSHSEDHRPATAAAWLEVVQDAERRGELLTAFDLAERALAEHPGDVQLQYRAVLALARSGSTAEAATRFESYGLSSFADEDVSGLGARIKKDIALATDGDKRRRLAAGAAEAYRSIYDRTGGYYPAVNAATLSFIAGDLEAATTLAGEVLRLVSDGGDRSYYAMATEAEAYLLLGDLEAAGRALQRAALVHGGDYGALSTTRRQLRIVCLAGGFDPRILTVLAGTTVVHFCGHRIAAEGDDGPFRAADEADVARRIDRALETQPVAFAYGSLASGGDILWAEALLARGAELHIVLPFALEEFLARSVAPAGARWVDRFRRCLQGAATVSYATVDAYLDEDVLYRYCAELAMGLALLRARYLDAEALQLALWDGEEARGEAGTAIDVATWRRTGHQVTVVSPHGRAGSCQPLLNSEPKSHAIEPAPAVGDDRGRDRRVVKAMLFADVRGYSSLTDEQFPRFSEYVLAAFAHVLHRHGAAVEYRNTWGDALYVVLSDPVSAAACALDLQDAMTTFDFDAASLPGHLALRLGGHVGPIFPVLDPILQAPAFIGSHVSRTARIEPVTPCGAVYVTEPFVAALELAGEQSFACDYVGHMPAAKDYGRLRMYRLRRRSAGQGLGV